MILTNLAMSFKCELCFDSFNYAPHRRVLQTRPVKYDTQFVNAKGHKVSNVSSTGEEIDREVLVCSSCAKSVPKAPKIGQKTKFVKSSAIKKRKHKAKAPR